MPVEIEDAELARLRGAEKLMGELIKSPKTKRTVEKAIKELPPDVVTDEDVAEPFVKPLNERIEKLEARLRKEDDTRLENDFQAKLDYYRKNHDYTDEGIDKIKALMKERTIPDVDAAVALFEKLNPPKPQQPSGFQPTGWNLGKAGSDSEEDKLLFTNEDLWAEREAVKAWNDAKRETIGTG